MAFSTPLQCEVLSGQLKNENKKGMGEFNYRCSVIGARLSDVGLKIAAARRGVPICRKPVLRQALKKVQMQGGVTHPEGWVRGARGTHPEDGSQQMGLFQRPARWPKPA